MSKFSTPINASAIATANTTTVLYTVPVDKVLHIYSYWCNAMVTPGGGGTTTMYTDDGAPVYYFAYFNQSVIAAVNNENVATSGSCPEPVVVAAGETVELTSNAASCFSSGGFNGVLLSI